MEKILKVAEHLTKLRATLLIVSHDLSSLHCPVTRSNFANVFGIPGHSLRNRTFGRFDTIQTCDRQMDT